MAIKPSSVLLPGEIKILEGTARKAGTFVQQFGVSPLENLGVAKSLETPAVDPFDFSTQPLLRTSQIPSAGEGITPKEVVATPKSKKGSGVFDWLKNLFRGNNKAQKVPASTSPSSTPVSPSRSRKPMTLRQKVGLFLSGLGLGLSTHFMPEVKNLVPAFTAQGEKVEQVLNHNLSGRIAKAEKEVIAGTLKDFVQVPTPHGTAVFGLKGHKASEVQVSKNKITLPNGKVINITPQVVTPQVQVSLDGNKPTSYQIK